MDCSSSPTTMNTYEVDKMKDGEWYYPSHFNIRIRKINNNIELSTMGYSDDTEYYKD